MLLWGWIKENRVVLPCEIQAVVSLKNPDQPRIRQAVLGNSAHGYQDRLAGIAEFNANKLSTVLPTILP